MDWSWWGWHWGSEWSIALRLLCVSVPLSTKTLILYPALVPLLSLTTMGHLTACWYRTPAEKGTPIFLYTCFVLPANNYSFWPFTCPFSKTICAKKKKKKMNLISLSRLHAQDTWCPPDIFHTVHVYNDLRDLLISLLSITMMKYYQADPLKAVIQQGKGMVYSPLVYFLLLLFLLE